MSAPFELNKESVGKEEHLSDWDPSLNRRDFLSISVASLAAAGFSGCIRPPIEKIFPYVTRPEEESLPGDFHYFATSYVIGGVAHGILAASHQGRPIKIEGNPTHPANLGTASVFQQAHVLSLYDPDRAQTVRGPKESKPPGNFKSAKGQFENEVNRLRAQFLKTRGKGLVFLTERITSLALHHQLQKLQTQFPEMKWIQYEPLQLPLQHSYPHAQIDFSQIKNMVSFDSDLFSDPLFPVTATADLMKNKVCEIFSLEVSPTLLGLRADYRIAMKPSKLFLGAGKIAELLGIRSEAAPKNDQKTLHVFSEVEDQWIDQLVKKIIASAKAGEASAFIADASAPLALQELVYALNLKFGKKAVHYRESASANKTGTQNFALSDLTASLDAHQVEALVIIAGNPAYASPGTLDFSRAIQNAKWSARFGLYEDETAQACQWFLPISHDLESFGDARTSDGTTSLLQPLLAPLYDGMSASQIVEFFQTGKNTKSQLALLQEILGSPPQINKYKTSNQTSATKKFPSISSISFKESLRTGILSKNLSGGQNSEYSSTAQTSHAQASSVHSFTEPFLTNFANLAASTHLPLKSGDTNAFELQFVADRHVYDGRMSNHPWLQEFPDPVTRITWENVALIHPEDAKIQNLKSGEIVRLISGTQSIETPIWIQPGQAKGCLTLSFGYGRTHAGRVGNDHGYNAYILWDGNRYGSASLEKTGKHTQIACTQEHHSMEGRDLVRVMDQATATEKPKPYYASLYPDDPTPEEYAWSMVIDLDQCTGCGACVIACQSENNIPVVGKAGVLVGREMHWIRVDRYFASAGEKLNVHFQPVTCMHCEKAPCETVCPTEATVHGNGGLNQMVYNRCVGTRYCSNNCPYKVRRFNFLSYTKTTQTEKLQKNPNVSIRSRGVMEKCSYCVQKINQSRVTAEIENRRVRDQEVKTACQMTCPSHAIQFGDLRTEDSIVRKQKESPRNYALLGELGTQPRTTYLAKIARQAGC